MTTTKIRFDYFRKQYDIFFGGNEKYVIVPKGRRGGATRGAQQAYIEWALDGITPMLWVDTINGNIDRYYERYFRPSLSCLPSQIEWKWNQQKRELRIADSTIDFRSADIPENIEGFGYRKIFLNEAGIILRDPYLYNKAILPMLLDYSDSQLIAAGVPKGKFTRDGIKHTFYTLYEKALTGHKDYRLVQVTTYDNPLIHREEIEAMINEMDEPTVQQEIYGQFVVDSGDNPFLYNYNPGRHESRQVSFNQKIPIIISFDFNLHPFACSIHQIWVDSTEHHYIIDEIEIKQGSIQNMAARIREKYGGHLYAAKITGDYTATAKQLAHKNNFNLYLQLIAELGMSEQQIQLSPNPSIANSKAHCNAFLVKHPDFKVNPDTCPNMAFDLKNVQCDAFGDVIKRNRNIINQRADFFDTFRYVIHNFQQRYNAIR